jgi:hypothetical protein
MEVSLQRHCVTAQLNEPSFAACARLQRQPHRMINWQCTCALCCLLNTIVTTVFLIMCPVAQMWFQCNVAHCVSQVKSGTSPPKSKSYNDWRPPGHLLIQTGPSPKRLVYTEYYNVIYRHCCASCPWETTHMRTVCYDAHCALYGCCRFRFLRLFLYRICTTAAVGQKHYLQSATVLLALLWLVEALLLLLILSLLLLLLLLLVRAVYRVRQWCQVYTITVCITKQAWSLLAYWAADTSQVLWGNYLADITTVYRFAKSSDVVK